MPEVNYEGAIKGENFYVDAETAKLDAQAIRPLHAKVEGTATEDDIEKLKEVEAKVMAYRAELSTMQ